jgi:predicted acyl esterase
VVQVQSSGFPDIDRNRQTFCDIDRAKPGDYRPPTQRVYRVPNAASGLRVLVAPR